jgi:hypothetical protein
MAQVYVQSIWFEKHIIFSLEMLLLRKLEEMFGILNIHGQINFVHVAQIWSNVNLIDIIIEFLSHILGCFAFFCPCCFECKLFKRAGENMCTGMCPGGTYALRSKIRTAFRIEVRFFCIINLNEAKLLSWYYNLDRFISKCIVSQGLLLPFRVPNN